MDISYRSLTDQTQYALALAAEEAERLGHHTVDTGHLLLGLLRVRDGLAAQMLASWGVEVPTVRAMQAELLGCADGRSWHRVTLAPTAKQALRLALEEARALKQP